MKTINITPDKLPPRFVVVFLETQMCVWRKHEITSAHIEQLVSNNAKWTESVKDPMDLHPFTVTEYEPGDEIPVEVARKMHGEGNVLECCQDKNYWGSVFTLFAYTDKELNKKGWIFRIPPAEPKPDAMAVIQPVMSDSKVDSAKLAGAIQSMTGELEYIPLGPEDVPPGSAVRFAGDRGWRMITKVIETAMVIDGDIRMLFATLYERNDAQIKRPGKDWQLCRKPKGQAK